MGMYDTFCGPCPKCEKEVQIQTKAFNCCLQFWTPGKRVLNPTQIGAIQNCYHDGCDETLAAVIEDGIFIGYQPYDELKNRKPNRPLYHELKDLLTQAVGYMRCGCRFDCSCGQRNLKNTIQAKLSEDTHAT